MELISFSVPKRSVGRRDSADCKQRRMKWSARPHRSLPHENPREFYDDFWVLERLIILLRLNISEITRPNMLISYFTAYLIHYFYNSKTRGDRQKRTSDSESKSKIHMNKKVKSGFLYVLKVLKFPEATYATNLICYVMARNSLHWKGTS